MLMFGADTSTYKEFWTQGQGIVFYVAVSKYRDVGIRSTPSFFGCHLGMWLKIIFLWKLAPVRFAMKHQNEQVNLTLTKLPGSVLCSSERFLRSFSPPSWTPPSTTKALPLYLQTTPLSHVTLNAIILPFWTSPALVTSLGVNSPGTIRSIIVDRVRRLPLP